MNLIILAYGYFLVFSFFASTVFVSLVRRFALKYGIVAIPREDRLHKEKTPLLGGVGIFASFYFTILFNLLCVQMGMPFFSEHFEELHPFMMGAVNRFDQLVVILIAAGAIFLLGLLDDFKSLGPKRKLLYQVLLATILYFNDIRVTVFPGLEVVGFILTVGWIVFITNAFNLLDNVDGLTGGVAVIASFILLMFCIIAGQVLISILLLIFIGALLGFLKYNYPPASIFMGDAGSLFIGFMLGTLTVMSTFQDSSVSSLVPVVAPVMILSVPIYDTISVVMIRVKNRKSIFVGDKNHFSHRLLAIGMSTRQAISFIYLIGLCTGMAALTLRVSDTYSQVILLFQTILLVIIIHLLKTVHLEKNGQTK